ncbi:replication initiation protein [Cetobacterium sp. 2A]|uniref:replication initiation protein n=1 Tax=Cetobacterium sp. 2A TaxID=2754723 RepID=UPI00163BFE08|nr:replication initiation protein [Cetobacterium sp. 2A]MBC2856989.1 replication initiation protein [Cetobacterium sp. 2A]
MKKQLDLFKPSIIITNNVPLTASQLDLFNYFLKGAYEQLEKNVLVGIFKFSVEEIKENCSSRLNSYNKIFEEVKEIYDKQFEFNILGKDKQSGIILSRFIPSIVQNKNNLIEITLEPITINALRMMIAKKQKIDLPGMPHSELEISPYLSLSYQEHKNIKFYPAKVIYEIVKDYEGYPIPEINIDDFKKITDTLDKYTTTYATMVLKKIENILNENYNITLKLTSIKQGRVITAIKIESDLNRKKAKEVTYEEIENEYKKYLIAGGLDPNKKYPKATLLGYLNKKKYKLKD